MTNATATLTERRFSLTDLLLRSGLPLFLVVLLVLFSVLAPRFASVNNAFIILSAIAVIGIVSIGQTLAIVSGGFDLSTNGVVPLASILYATFLNAGLGVFGATLATLVIGGLVGVVNGLVITKLKINPLITTLGMLSITAGLAASIANGVSVPFENPEISFLGGTSFGNIANVVWVFLIFVVAGILVMRYTVFGRSLYSIGGNRDAAWLAGLKVDGIITAVYTISAALASFAGIVLASQLLTGSTTVGTDSALTSIAAVVLGGGSLAGGVGSIAGTVVGVLVLGVFQNGLALMHVAPYYQQIATGAILLIAVAFSQLRQRERRKYSARPRGSATKTGPQPDGPTPTTSQTHGEE